MSSTLSDSDGYSLPSSDNESTRDYGDKDGYDVLYPPETSSDEIEMPRSIKIHVPPMILRLENQIRNILGEVSDEYATFLANIIYDWKYKNQPIPIKYKIIAAYINKRIFNPED